MIYLLLELARLVFIIAATAVGLVLAFAALHDLFRAARR